MENVTSLIPRSLQRSTEEKMLVSKVVRHVQDYIEAVKKYGPRFYEIPINEENPYRGTNAKELAKMGKIKTLLNGRIAYRYFFIDNENDFGLEPVCELLDFNAATFRNRLRNLTKAEAKKLWVLFLRGIGKCRYTGQPAGRKRPYHYTGVKK